MIIKLHDLIIRGMHKSHIQGEIDMDLNVYTIKEVKLKDRDANFHLKNLEKEIAN